MNSVRRHAAKILFLSAVLPAFLASCSTVALFYPLGKSWPPEGPKVLGSAQLGTIRVDKSADWDSVEAETRRLVPLLLREKGYVEGPEYLIEVVLIEREYMENWKTRRSLSAEIRIRENGGTGEKAPVAAGKALFLGKKSLSSSKVLNDLLKAALSQALRALSKRTAAR
ncbi:MAG: hypothetical protein LBC31_07545 [Treponema sp.]|jgi:hypothetical protein|nr:hypothetical protein [Treponema sp.]